MRKEIPDQDSGYYITTEEGWTFESHAINQSN